MRAGALLTLVNEFCQRMDVRGCNNRLRMEPGISGRVIEAAALEPSGGSLRTSEGTHVQVGLCASNVTDEGATHNLPCPEWRRRNCDCLDGRSTRGIVDGRHGVRPDYRLQIQMGNACMEV